MQRLRVGLADLYRYFRAGHAMLANIERDAAFVPDRVRGVRLAKEQLWRDTLLRQLPGRRRATVRGWSGTPQHSGPGTRSASSKGSRTARPCS